MKTSALVVLSCLLAVPTLCAQEPSGADALRDEILAQDRAYFDAYNTCDMETQAALLDDDLEFFHDQGGLSTSKPEILESIERNICGKVRRELVQGSVEVYPIAGYGAVAIGLHRFHNLVEQSVSPPGRFVTVWRQGDDAWTMTRVISLHTGPATD